MAVAITDRKGLEAFLPPVPTTPHASVAPRKSRKARALGTHIAPKQASKMPLVPVMDNAETVRNKTVRLGQLRMVNLLRSIRLWGNLSGRYYDWKEGEVDRMYQAAIEALRQERAKFDRHSRNKQKLEETFSLTAE